MTNFYIIYSLVFALFNYTPFQTEGLSMYPTLRANEVFIIDKSGFRDGNLKRGDIIVFTMAENDKYFYVKRIIGMPGEYLRIDHGGVWIRGDNFQYSKVTETYLGAHKFDYGDARYFIVPENKYFVMGDNRSSSKDSRFFEDPYISESHVSGRLIWKMQD